MATGQDSAMTEPCQPGPSRSTGSGCEGEAGPQSDDAMSEGGDFVLKDEVLSDNSEDGEKSEDGERKDKPKLCSTCNEKVLGNEAFREHLINEHSIKPWDCLKCGGVFSNTSALIRHDLRHDMPYQCVECDMTYAEITKMRKHMLDMHGELKSMRCNICKVKTFKSKCDLYEHVSEHRGPYPFKCLEPGCREVFTKLASVVRHMKKVHMGEEVNVKPKKYKKKMKCSVCMCMYETFTTLLRHQENMHPQLFKDPKFRGKQHFIDCTGGRKYIPTALKEGHIYGEGKLDDKAIERLSKPFKCLNCEMAFPRYSMFHKHMLRFHYGIDPGYGKRHEPYTFRFKYDTGIPEEFRPNIPYEDY